MSPRPIAADRLVGCLVPKGLGMELMTRLFREKGLTRVSVHSARGFMGSDPRGLFNRVEKELLTAIVAPDRAEEVFQWIYREAQVAEVEGRLLYMAPVQHASPFVLPADIPIEQG